MKEIAEKVISLNGFEYPETLAMRIENMAEDMHKKGWFFTHSSADELMENIVLFFERDYHPLTTEVTK